jgi:membrane protein required for colicin V production
MADVSLNMFDLGVLIIVGLSALLSFFRGFVRELTSLAAWIGASVITLRFMEPVSAWLKPQVHNDAIASAIASIGLFLVTLITISIAMGLILKVLKPGAKVGLFDNLVGLCFGVARGVLIVAIAYFVMSKFFVDEKNYPDVVKQAMSRPYVEKAANWVGTFTPSTLNAITDKKTPDADSLKNSAAKISKALNGGSSTAPDEDSTTTHMPSIEDLQERIREENEKN